MKKEVALVVVLFSLLSTGIMGQEAKTSSVPTVTAEKKVEILKVLKEQETLKGQYTTLKAQEQLLLNQGDVSVAKLNVLLQGVCESTGKEKYKFNPDTLGCDLQPAAPAPTPPAIPSAK